MTAYEILQASQAAPVAQQSTATAQPQTAPDLDSTLLVAAGLRDPQHEDILSRAVLVTFNLSIPGNNKVDRATTDRVQKSERMGVHSGRWDKCVFPPARFKRLSSVAAAARAWHYANTLDWPVSGIQLLPLANHGAYCQGMRDWKRQVEAARDEFLAALPEMIEWAKTEHNGSFDPALYSESEIRAKFAFDIAMDPVPSTSHYLTAVRNVLGVDASGTDDRVKTAIEKAESNLWDRLAEPLRNVADILWKKDNGDRTRITESLLENIMAIAKQVPALNVNENPALAQFAAEAEQAFKGYTTEALSADEQKRKEARDRATDILRRMTGRKS